MKKLFSTLQEKNILYPLLILLIGMVTYLLFINRLGLYGDDWYLLFDGHTQGPQFFHVVFSSDRPARGYLVSFIYSIFGDHLIYYHLGAFLLRYIGSIALYWSFNQIWEQHKFLNFLMAMFTMIYPGFLAQIQPVDYFSQICSLSLAMYSIAFTISSIREQNKLVVRVITGILAILTGWVYLALVEYFIGIEFLRLFFIFCLARQNTESIKPGIKKALVQWVPFTIIPLGFLAWRLLIFHGTRIATDVSLQLGVYLETPLLRGFHWIVNTILGFINVVFSAWFVPFYNILVIGGIRLRDILVVLAIASGALAILLLIIRSQFSQFVDEPIEKKWRQQLFWGGLICTFVGILPVIFSNRTVDFISSRYSLGGMVGAVMLLVSGLSFLKSRRLQLAFVGLLAFLSMGTHLGNAVISSNQAISFRTFWWQVSWRAPQIQRGTTLVASYSLYAAPEDYDIWGPANLIYYPEKSGQIPIPIQIPAILSTDSMVNTVLSNRNFPDHDERGNMVEPNFGSMLVITQVSPNACVRILDGARSELSESDSSEIKLLAPYSQIDQVSVNGTQAVVPSTLFGPEPAHTWCYYYEKAAAARQNEDWETVVTLAEEAIAKGYKPVDTIEWMPFLEGYVATGQIDKLQNFHPITNGIPLTRIQTCRVLQQTAAQTRPNDSEMKKFIEDYFCP